jgi:cytochrome b561
LPIGIHGWERKAAKAGHWALYVLMLLMPLSGWMLVSSSSYGLPTIVFGWFEWPHVPGVAGNEIVHEGAETAHFILAILFILVIGGHIGAVVKHWIFEKENLLKRIWWSS